ncbi:MAG: hypothetical protein UT43_C0017G0028 [Parcubacteria group bacterium GW2011_GWC1_39_29]|nr:MAG: hypothetical protein UT43_C0017G0028 [Parcubacteria group bacterium GW2011_GWC1_39_29]
MIFQRLKDWWRGGNLFGARRSSKWPAVRKAFLAGHPNCEVCGGKGTFLKPNELHHCQPYHLRPDLELLSEITSLFAT